MDKMRMKSVDITDQNIEKIGALFPNVITEAKDENGKLTKAINFELLKQQLSKEIVDGDEVYEFTWVGKKAAIVEANKPIRKTLRPCKKESVNWDTTENLYIEGDNLEVLKLLQESYLGKVKMIYIDPPYNTGNDFIYEDDFSITREDYDENSGAIDEYGDRLFRNTDSNGRFHSDWCSMIYSRMTLARNLLEKDGILFVSIDDNEQENLKRICDEIFGEDNFITQFIWRRSGTGGLRGVFPITTHEYILAYSKHKTAITQKWMAPYSESSSKAFNNSDQNGAFKTQALYLTSLKQTPGQSYYIELPDGTYARPPEGIGSWRYIEDTYKKELASGKILFKESKNSPLITKEGKHAAYNIYTKQYIDSDGSNPASILPEDVVKQTRAARAELKHLFGQDIFDYAKPTNLIKFLIEMANIENDSIILDFFSGSGTTAHSIMQLNAEDSGSRKYILVQLPEKNDESSTVYKAGFKNICEIGKERIRRAAKKIHEEHPDAKFDDGFRVLKVDESNMTDVYYSADSYDQNMLNQLESNIKSDRTDLDLLFGCLLEWGLPLSMPYVSEDIEGCKVHTYNDGDLIACFDNDIPEHVIKEIAKRKPLRAVFRDSGFKGSPEKINVGETFKLLSPDTRVKII